MPKDSDKKSVLIIDDEQHGETIANYLERAGYYTIYFKEGKTAFEEIQSGLKYNIAIIDYSLPEIPGNDIVLLSKKNNPEAPVIVISGYDKVNHNGDLFIAKPFTPDLMDEKIRMLFAN